MPVMGYVPSIVWGRKKVGPWADCSQNLVRAHKMLRPRAQMTLEKCWLTSIPNIYKVVLEPRVSPAFAITYFCNHCNIRFENTSKYVDTLTFFPKTWTKGHWPLDDLWPHVSWGHMCDSTQGSLCPSPMTVHQCMWIQWSWREKVGNWGI